MVWWEYVICLLIAMGTMDTLVSLQEAAIGAEMHLGVAQMQWAYRAAKVPIYVATPPAIVLMVD